MCIVLSLPYLFGAPSKELYTENRERVVDARRRDKICSWLKLYIIVSGLLTASTYLALLSPYVDEKLTIARGASMIGTPLVPDNSQILYWVRGLSAVSFVMSVACIAASFTHWVVISAESPEDMAKAMPPSDIMYGEGVHHFEAWQSLDAQEKAKKKKDVYFIIWNLVLLQRTVLLSAAASFTAALMAVLLAVWVLIDKCAAIFAFIFCTLFALLILSTYIAGFLAMRRVRHASRSVSESVGLLSQPASAEASPSTADVSSQESA